MDLKDGIVFYLRKTPSNFGKIHSEAIKKKKHFIAKKWPRLLRSRKNSNERMLLTSLSNTTSFIKNYEKKDEVTTSTRSHSVSKSYRLYKRPNSRCIKKLLKRTKVKYFFFSEFFSIIHLSQKKLTKEKPGLYQKNSSKRKNIGQNF